MKKIGYILLLLVLGATVSALETKVDTSWTITTTTLLEDSYISDITDTASHFNTIDTMRISEDTPGDRDQTVWVRCMGIDTLLDSGITSDGTWVNYVFDSAYLQLTWRSLTGYGADDSCNLTINRVLKSVVAAEIDWNESKTGTNWGSPGALNATDKVSCADAGKHTGGTVKIGVSASYTTQKFWFDTTTVWKWLRTPADSNQGLMIDATTLINCTEYHINCASEDNATSGNRPVFVVYGHYYPAVMNKLHGGILHQGRLH